MPLSTAQLSALQALAQTAVTGAQQTLDAANALVADVEPNPLQVLLDQALADKAALQVQLDAANAAVVAVTAERDAANAAIDAEAADAAADAARLAALAAQG